jgi:hypothetical protein
LGSTRTGRAMRFPGVAWRRGWVGEGVGMIAEWMCSVLEFEADILYLLLFFGGGGGVVFWRCGVCVLSVGRFLVPFALSCCVSKVKRKKRMCTRR